MPHRKALLAAMAVLWPSRRPGATRQARSFRQGRSSGQCWPSESSQRQHIRVLTFHTRYASGDSGVAPAQPGRWLTQAASEVTGAGAPGRLRNTGEASAAGLAWRAAALTSGLGAPGGGGPAGEGTRPGALCEPERRECAVGYVRLSWSETRFPSRAFLQLFSGGTFPLSLPPHGRSPRRLPAASRSSATAPTPPRVRAGHPAYGGGGGLGRRSRAPSG